jgi:hypothetical protein
MQKNLQFVTDAEGRKTAVILPIEEYEEMMEGLVVGRAIRESKGHPRWVAVSFAMASLSKRQSSPRKRESSTWTGHF